VKFKVNINILTQFAFENVKYEVKISDERQNAAVQHYFCRHSKVVTGDIHRNALRAR
jgi:hypothetical protein